MLGVGATFDVRVRRSAHLLTHFKLENGKVRDGTVVHEAMPPEDKRVVVDGRDRRSTCCTYVSHENSSLCIVADRVEIQVVCRRLDALVHSRSQAFLLGAVSRFASVSSLEVGIRRCVPDNAQTINVVDHIASSDQVILGDITRIMRYQSWKKMLVNLICERVLG